MQRICFCKTVSLFNHVLQPSQAIALFYQSLIFSLKNLALIRWISSTIDIPTGLQLLMIDFNGNVTVDDDLLYKHLSNAKRETEQRTDTTSILKWISRIVLRLANDCSISSKSDRSIEFESFNDFLKQFHTMTTDDRSTLSDDDEGISSDDMDDEDISRRAIHRALMKCIDYTLSCSMSNNKENQLSSSDMQDFESNSIALYNQQIIQILCSDTLELEIELARDLRQSSFETPSTTSSSLPSHDNTFYSVWAALWRDVTTEYLQFSGTQRLRKTSLDSTQISTHLADDQRRWSMRENDRVLDEIAQRQQNLRKIVVSTERKVVDSTECLHDRLMSEIKQQRVLKPIVNRSLMSNTSSLDTSRKRIRPVQTSNESDFSSDDEDERDEFGRKRVAVIECLLESSPEENLPRHIDSTSTSVSVQTRQSIDDDFVNLTIDTLSSSTKTSTKNSSKASAAAFEHLQIGYISMEEILRVCSSLSLLSC